MKRKYQITLIFAFILIFLISFASTWLDNGELTQNVDGCNILNTTGATYTLTQSVSSTGTCFTVTSPNVTLDCNGYWINYTGTDSENAYGLYTNQFNTTLKNCNIYNYTIGAYYHGASNGTIQNNTIQIYQNRTIPITDYRLSPMASGILLYDFADYNLIINTTSYSQYGRGIYLNRATNNTIINSNGSSDLNPGIQIYTTSGQEIIGYNNTILNSYAYSNSDAGLLIGYYGGGNEVINSIIVSNSSQLKGHALLMEHSDYNKIVNTTGHSFNRGGIFVTAGVNILILNSTGISEGTNSPGISLDYSTTGSTIINSTGIAGINYTQSCGIMIRGGEPYHCTNNILVDSTGISVGGSGSGICIGGINNTVRRSTAIGGYGYEFRWNATDIFVEDCVNTTWINYGVYYSRDFDVDAIFLNCSYVGEWIQSANSNLTRKWYYQSYVNDTLGNSLSNVNVTAYNSTGHLQFTQQTNNSGLIDIQEVIEYINKGGIRTHSSNYLIGAYLEGHPPAKNHIIDFTQTKNKVDDWFTIREPDFTPPLITIISPIGTIADVTPLINVSLSEETRVWYSVDEGENITLCEECDFSDDKFLYSNEGEHIFRVFANDSSGNFNTTFVSFIIDMENNYYDDFEDNSSIYLLNDAVWNKGNVSFRGKFDYLDDPNLVSIYLFNDSNNLGFDLKGNNNMYDERGTPSISSIIPSGKTGYSINLSGNSEVCIPRDFTFNPSEDHTMCFWVRKNSFASNSNVFAQHCIYDTWEGTEEGSYRFTSNNCYKESTSLRDNIYVFGVYSQYEWVHICQKYDSNNYNMTIYVNGAEDTSKILDYPIAYELNGVWCIGGCDYGCYMNGNVFEPMWFDRHLSSEEIESIYSSEGYGYYLGNFTSYPINTTKNIGRITNITWTEINTDENNNITVQVSVDGGENWYNATSGEGLEQNFVGTNNSLVYRVIFSTLDSLGPIVISDINISWSNTIDFLGQNECGVLDETGATYILTKNVSSTGTCFTITQPNITLDCNGHWINYSTSGWGNQYGVYSNQFNTTIKNCNIIDGNWVSDTMTRNGIYFDGADNSTLYKNFVASNNSNAIDLRSGSSYLNVINNTGISISNRGIYFSVTHSTIINNVGMSNSSHAFDIGAGSDNNIFVNDIGITNTTNGNGIILYFADNNTLINCSGTSRNEGVGIFGSVYNEFIQITAIGIGGNSKGIRIDDYSNNSVFRDCLNITSNSINIVAYKSLNSTFINCTYGLNEDYVDSGSELIRKWYYQAYVNDTLGNPLSNVNISARNSTNQLQFTQQTNSSGLIDRQEVIEYIHEGGTRTYYNNYTINASLLGYETQSKTFNLTVTGNKLDDVFTLNGGEILDIIPPSIVFKEPPTPENASTVYSSNQTIIANISDTSITSSWIDFDKSLVGYWSMDYFNDTGVYDNSSYNNFGRFNGGLSPSDSVDGARGQGLMFDGIDDYILANDILNMGQEFTISIWANTHGNNSGVNKIGGMFTKYNFWGVSGGDGLLIQHRFAEYFGGSGMTASVRIGNYSTEWIEDEVYIDVGYPLDTWRHYTIIWDYPYLSTYLNGEYVANKSFPYLLSSSWRNVQFGTMFYPDWFNGSIDEVMIFNRTLSETEILALYNSQSNLFNVTFDNLEFGQHNYTIYAADEYGNTADSGLRNFILSEDKLIPGENACGVLDEEGKTYVLTENVSSTGTCFTVTSPNVVLDCNGYWINYSIGGAENTYGIVNYYNNVTIKNCNVIDGNESVDIWNRVAIMLGGEGAKVYNNYVHTNNSIGIYSSEGSNFIIENNTVQNTHGSAMLLWYGNNITYINNYALSNDSYGIRIRDSINTLLIGNIGESRSNEDSPGIFICDGSINTTLINCTGISYNYYGMHLHNAVNTTAINSMAISNLIPIVVYSSSESTFINQTYSLGNVGMYIDGSNNTLIRDSNILGLDKVLYLDSNSTNNTFLNCSYDTTKEHVVEGSELTRKWYYQAYINDTKGNPLDNARVVAAYNLEGDLEFTNYTNSTGWIPRQEITEYVNDGGTRNYYSNYALAATFEGYSPEMVSFNLTNETKNRMDYFFTLEKGVPGEDICGVLDEVGKTYVLTENVFSIGTCFEITADNITLDCNGHWINYSQIEFGYGVDVNECNGARIKNCNIAEGAIEFSHGILLYNSNNSEVFNNSIFTSGVLSDSISLYTSNFTNIYNNTLYTYKDLGHSIYSRSSMYNTVSNLIIYAYYNGIYLEYGSHNWSISNLSVFVNNSFGIVLDAGSDNILLNNINVTSNNEAMGIFINSSLNNVSNVNISCDLNSSLILNGIGNNIVNSTFYSNSEYSVYLVGGVNNTLINNTLLGAKEYGFLLRISKSSGNNLFYWNNFTETEGYFINNRNGTNHFNTTISGTPQGNYYFGISSKKIYDSNNNGWGDKGSEYPLNADNWEEKWMGDGADYGPSTSRKEDLAPPTFTEVSHTDNIAGENCWFRINISDNIGLHPDGGYIFSTNNSGSWVNNSFARFTSTPNFVNLRVVLNSNVGMTIGYRWYFNDTSGNNASTPIYTLTTQEKKVENPVSGGGGGGSDTGGIPSSGEENPLFKPTYEQIQEGYEVIVSKGYLILLNLSEKGQHLLEIAKIDSSTGVVQVLINSSSYFIDSDESVKIDLTGDNHYDLEMSVLSVSQSNNSSRMKFKEIHEEMGPLDVPIDENNSIDNKTVIEIFGGRTKIRLSKYAYIFSITLIIILILLVGYFVFKRIKKFGH